MVLGSIVPSALIACAIGYLVRYISPRLGFVDRPDRRKQHDRVMPLGGGLAILAGLVLPLAAGNVLAWAINEGRLDPLAWSPPLPESIARLIVTHAEGVLAQSANLWLLISGGTLVLTVGLVDDWRGLDWRWRLGAQTAVAVALVTNGYRLSLFIELPSVTATISVIWIVGLINSFNMLDNLDGLSGGVATIAASILATVLLLAPDPTTNQPQFFIGGLLLVLVGATLGFLWHNWPPARLFMGDGGSYLLGYMLAACTIMATFAGGDVPPHAVFAPLCILAVPIYDTLSVLIIRFRQRRNPFAADRSHFSHRLLNLGMTRVQVLLTIYLATATTGLGALLLHQVNAYGAAVILLLVACVLLLVAILEMAGHRQQRP